MHTCRAFVVCKTERAQDYSTFIGLSEGRLLHRGC